MKSFARFVLESGNFYTEDPEEKKRMRARDIRKGRDPDWEEKDRIKKGRAVREARAKAKANAEGVNNSSSSSTGAQQRPPGGSTGAQQTNTSTQTQSGSRQTPPGPPPQKTSIRSKINRTFAKNRIGTRLTYGSLAAAEAEQGRYDTAALLAANAAAPRQVELARRMAQRSIRGAFNRAGQKALGKGLSKIVPGTQQYMAARAAADAAKRGDVVGTGLGLASGLPGYFGLGAAAIDAFREPLSIAAQRGSELNKQEKDLAKELGSQTKAKTIGGYADMNPSAPVVGSAGRGGERSSRGSANVNLARSRASSTVMNRAARDVAGAYGQYGSSLGSALTGAGGDSFVTFNKKNIPFASTGVGKNRRTVQLPSTQLVRDPRSGRQVVGDLAFRNGVPIYLSRGSVASRDTSTNVGGIWRNLQRSLNFGGQRARDAAASRREYRTALGNTQRYTRGLNITPQRATNLRLPGYGVGPRRVGSKIVGPKKVGPKIVGPRRVGSGTGGSTRPGSPVRPLVTPA